MIQYSFVYAAAAKSSLKVLGELLKISEAPVNQLAETRDGFVASISIPGDANSGAIYVYHRPTASMSSLTVDNRDSDFSPSEIAVMFPAVVKHLNTPCKVRSTRRTEFSQKRPENNQSQRHQQKRHHNRPRRKPATAASSARPERAQIAA